MWILIQEPKPSGSKLDSEHLVEQAQNKWGLLPGHIYTVGRLNGDITSPGDSTVSKEHAKITVIQNEDRPRPEVVLEDVGAKLGTFMNEDILAESQRLAACSGGLSKSKALKKPRVLEDNDRVRFGVAYSIFRLKWLEFTVTSSMLSSKADRTNLSIWLQEVQKGCEVQQAMSEKTSHLVMNIISLSIKVVNCLAQGIPIVTPQFFSDLVQCLKTKQKLPLEEAFLPPVSSKETESQLRDPTVSFNVNYSRSRVFKDKLFVFVDKKQFDVNSPPCKLAGGKTFFLETQDKVKAIKQHHVIISPPNSKALLADPGSLWSQVMAHITNLGMIAFSQTEIYFAIVYCSVENYCNPLRSQKAVNAVVGVGSSSVISNTANAVKTDGLMFVPDTCSVSGSPGPGVRTSSNSRLQVSETPSNPSSAVREQTQVLEPKLGDTQIVDKVGDSSLKRPRISDSEDEVEPPNKQQHIDKSKTDGPVASKVVSSPVKDLPQTQKDVEEKENVSSNRSAFKKPSNTHSISSSEDEEEDMFGFGSIKTKKRKNVSPIKSQNPTASKKMRHNEDEDDMEDIFGFDEKKETSKTKDHKTPSQSSQRKTTGSSSDNVASSDSIVERKRTKVSEDLKTSFRGSTTVVATATGFLGKSDITGEFKDGTMHEDVEVSTLSMSVAKINVSTNLLRPPSSKPRPRYVPNEVGRSIPNFKKFKRKENVTSRRLISLVKFDPREKMNQTCMDDWVQDHRTETSSRQDDSHNDNSQDQESEDFWNFDKTLASKRKASRR